MESSTAPNPSPSPSSGVGVPTLHHLSSSQSLRILWALEELVAANPSFTYKLELHPRVKARAPKELQSIHPLGLSPILVIEPPPQTSAGSPDEERTVVTESRLILQYLADHYSDGLWEPQSRKDKVRNTYFQEFANATLGPKMSTVLHFEVIPALLPFFVRPLASLLFNGVASIIKKDLERPFQLMEGALADSEAAGEQNNWFAGENIGLADFCLSWPMDLSTQRGYFDASKYPRIAAWLSRVHERDAYLQAKKKGGTYDLVTFDWK